MRCVFILSNRTAQTDFFLAESEKYRNTLRARDEEVKRLTQAVDSHSHEVEKKDEDRHAVEMRLDQLEAELISLRTVEGDLDLQKAENLLLKETIDRLRFEIDEISNANAAGNPGTAPASHTGTISKSWGAELARSMQEQIDDERPEEDEGIAESHSGDSTEGEEEMQTIITRKRVRRLNYLS